ncbi:metal ABC transporter solute-binding protein [Sporolactobacillus kofuensis]|uniref:Metal ABC transporter solute-binding protein n=1 Tax=Sporolactobacillus kofuensis TaxID=269672 RepID=A0ABW1WFT7_9BACL|nr:metal ABC transporter solute-binding protein [Sporolactobacillus kofuensis]
MIKRRSLKVTLFMSVLILLAGILSGCGSKSASNGNNSESKKISIVSAEDFYGEVAKAVGGNHVTVTSILNKPNMDPHDFEATPQTARVVSRANLVIYNGIGYDDWMGRLVSNKKDNQVIRVGEDVMNKKNGDNEHLWYQPETLPALAHHLADQLAKIDSAHADQYKENAATFITTLKPINEEVAKLRKRSDNKLVDVSEPVFDYMLEALGYKVANNHFEQAVEEESDPSPKDIAQMQQDIKKKKIAFFVTNTQEMSPTVEKMVSLANKHSVPVIKVTETLPAGKNYKSWMLDQLAQINKAQNK